MGTDVYLLGDGGGGVVLLAVQAELFGSAFILAASFRRSMRSGTSTVTVLVRTFRILGIETTFETRHTTVKRHDDFLECVEAPVGFRLLRIKARIDAGIHAVQASFYGVGHQQFYAHQQTDDRSNQSKPSP